MSRAPGSMRKSASAAIVTEPRTVTLARGAMRMSVVDRVEDCTTPSSVMDSSLVAPRRSGGSGDAGSNSVSGIAMCPSASASSAASDVVGMGAACPITKSIASASRPMRTCAGLSAAVAMAMGSRSAANGELLQRASAASGAMSIDSVANSANSERSTSTSVAASAARMRPTAVAVDCSDPLAPAMTRLNPREYAVAGSDVSRSNSVAAACALPSGRSAKSTPWSAADGSAPASSIALAIASPLFAAFLASAASRNASAAMSVTSRVFA